ncbi:MAG: chromosomal replication initiator DnaA [Devosia sp.]|nr:chromosomal replication initiator DnaA [Devosia sp.]
MQTMVAEAGRAPASRRRPAGRVLRFDPARADSRGWRLLELVATARHLRAQDLLGPDRGRAEVALARQLAMYLMHTHYCRIYSAVGRFFGRDRTTVSHACAVIEDLREEPAFDQLVGEIEARLSSEAALEREAAHVAA